MKMIAQMKMAAAAMVVTLPVPILNPSRKIPGRNSASVVFHFDGV